MQRLVLFALGVMAGGCRNDAEPCRNDADCVGSVYGPYCELVYGFCYDVLDEDHPLAANQSSGEFPYYHGFGFILPETATVSFDVASPDDDYYGVAIFTAAEWSAYRDNTSEQYTCCLHEDDTVVDDSSTLNAGEWYLGFWCRNSVYNCTVEYDVTARY